MPTYGRSFTLVNETQFDIFTPASGGSVVGKFTNEAGFLSYYEVCTFLAQTNTTLVWDSEQQVPFAYRNDGGIMVGFRAVLTVHRLGQLCQSTVRRSSEI